MEEAEASQANTKTTRKTLGPIHLVAGSSAYFALMLPCLLKLSDGQGFLIGNETYGVFASAAMLGCLLGGLACAALGALGLIKNRLRIGAVLFGSVCFAVGHIVMITITVVPDASVLLTAAGILFGMGAVVMAVAWSLLVVSSTFRELFIGCAASILGSMVLVTIINSLPHLPAVLFSIMLLAASIAVPVRFVLPDGLHFPQNNSLAALYIENDLLVKRASLADLLLLLLTPTIGFMLFIVHSASTQAPFRILNISAFQVGLTAAALFVLLLFRVDWKRAMLPYIYWMLLPAIAGVLLFCDSFPSTSPFSVAGGMGGFFFFSLLTLFSIAFILLVINQGEFSPLLSLGTIFVLVSVATQLGVIIQNSEMDMMQRGDMLLSASAAYFVYLLIVPIVQFWRTRRNTDGAFGDVIADEGETLTQTCDALAAAHGLSQRESEILGYLARGYNSPYIANVLVISESTARTHINRIYRKLGVRSRMQIIELVERPWRNLREIS
jgi:DNA-binding CsgD family transcriptional regulator